MVVDRSAQLQAREKFNFKKHSPLGLQVENQRLTNENARLGELATLDELTGLPNLRGFGIELTQTIDFLRSENSRNPIKRGFGIVYFDSIGFKKINDSLGKNTGDQAIQILSDQLRTHVRGVEMVARVGGDEFAAIFRVEKVATFLSLVNPQSDANYLPNRINPHIIDNLRTMLGQTYIDKCDGAGIFRADGFYITSNELNLPSEELMDLIKSRTDDITKKFEESGR
jgi:diguanylate cyclase (GGDEF)-like protein